MRKPVRLQPLVATDEAVLPCQQHPAELWFADHPVQLERAKALCVPCPVRATCLTGALSRREEWGVWGGQIFDGGTVIARKRPRGRPHKTAGDGISRPPVRPLEGRP
jgi:WhiB family transcriptional regulator, redox-sensing transcriptional regulator